MPNFRLRTENGYDYFEAVSALQKSIRRGLRRRPRFGPSSWIPSFQILCGIGSRFICSEDIGIADPQTIILVEALRQQYQLVKLRPDRRIILCNAVLALCQAKKSRLADNMTCVVNRRRVHEGWRLPIPDFAIDQTRRRGRRWGGPGITGRRRAANWKNEVPGLDTYKAEAMRLRKKYGKQKRGKEKLENGKETTSPVSGRRMIKCQHISSSEG